MAVDYEQLCNELTMTEIVRLQDMLSKALIRRFEKELALVFSDVVGSTPYFARFGDEAGRKLQQRHFDALQRAIAKGGGRVVDTAGDGAFMVFSSVDAATAAMVELQTVISLDNVTRPRDHQLQVRVGIHWGPALTDGEAVTGDSVNFASRVAGSGNAGEVRLSKDAFLAFTNLQFRLKCRMLPPTTLKGVPKPAELMVLDWRDRTIFPVAVMFPDTGEEIRLPEQDIITFGRLREQDGVAANDIVLQHPDRNVTQQISRWHFELRRKPDGFVLRAVSEALTEVDGTVLKKGQEVPIRPGAIVRVGNALRIQFVGEREPEADGGGATLMFKNG